MKENENERESILYEFSTRALLKLGELALTRQQESLLRHTLFAVQVAVCRA